MSELLGQITLGPFYALAILACPLGMGAMMWFMMRGGMHSQHLSSTSKPLESSVERDREIELARLQTEIDEIRLNYVQRSSDLNDERK